MPVVRSFFRFEQAEAVGLLPYGWERGRESNRSDLPVPKDPILHFREVAYKIIRRRRGKKFESPA